MTTLQQFLQGTPSALHSQKVIELLQSSHVKHNPLLFNHAVQYLRIKAIKGDVGAKVKLGTILDGQLMTAAAAQGDGDTTQWQEVLDKREAELWGQCIFDRWLSSAITPCLGLVESDLLARQKSNSTTNTSTGDDIPSGDAKSNDMNDNDNSNDGNNIRYFRLVDTILELADSQDAAATTNDSSEQTQQQQRQNTGSSIKGDMCYLIGLMRLKGAGLEKDIQRAVDYFKKASALEHDGASYQLAMMMEDHYRYPELYDMDESVALYEKMGGVSNGSATSTSSALNQGSNGGIVALSGPDARALTKLARVYYEGDHRGQSQDLEKAYQYARKVAERNGEKYCQFMVGDILLRKNDIQQSLFWLAQSGQQGFPLAIEALARIYFEGRPPMVKQDFEIAREWCLKGDDIWPSGLGYCQSCLGDMYRQGLGVPKDQMKSFEYYQKAASQQDSPQNYARYMLGEMFYHGDGWIQNIPVAKDYYQIAAQEQYEPARQRLLEIESSEQLEMEQKSMPQQRVPSKPWKFLSLFGSRRKASSNSLNYSPTPLTTTSL
ncbi:hypothetical protein BCR42DRAFT_417990 [Absidia repens]|uniref:HCP-like protein n=1 Tax=Absidia repens TaxID=90262 RepID=A0A1X2ICP7_9FUNG|nr:hypothetical protein BCR42DRAFT_417990 [Absidia repens]